MKRLIAIGCLLAASTLSVYALDAGDFSEVVGYVVLETTNVKGTFNGAEHDKLVALDNGMIFEFAEYQYAYAYRPDVVVFAKKVTYQGRDLILYKLLIEDDFYDVRRVK